MDDSYLQKDPGKDPARFYKGTGLICGGGKNKMGIKVMKQLPLLLRPEAAMLNCDD